MDRVYWDSDCFLGLLLDEPDKVSFCEEVISDAQDGKLQIITSALTVAEVLNVRHQPRIPIEKRKTVEDFFRNDFIVVRSVTRKTAEIARELVWDLEIKPKDAIHVATAIEAKLAVLHTFDGQLLKKSIRIPGTTPLSIRRPQVASPRLPFGEAASPQERS